MDERRLEEEGQRRKRYASPKKKRKIKCALKESQTKSQSQMRSDNIDTVDNLTYHISHDIFILYKST